MADVAKKVAASRGMNSGRIWTVPNLFTIFRLAAGIAICFQIEETQFVFVMVLLGSITDGLDGWIARKFNQCSSLGRRLDQIADFVFGLAVTYVILRWEGLTYYNLPIAGSIVIFATAVAFLRLAGWTANSSRLSKWRIALQFTAGVTIIATHAIPMPGAVVLRVLAYIVLWVSMYLMWRTIVGYVEKPDA